MENTQRETLAGIEREDENLKLGEAELIRELRLGRGAADNERRSM